MKTARLEIRLDPEELALVKELARRYGTTVSDLMRLLIKAAAASPSESTQPTLILDKRTLSALVRNVRALGHLLNQSAHALNTVALVASRDGIDAQDFAEQLGLVRLGLEEVRRDAEAVREQATAIAGMPVVLQ